tara:strand:+ start:83 stop:298 length:216 start_codon:yes stop_codon:yes gene_type:complete
MRIQMSYGNLIHQDGTIERKTTYHFDSLEELFDFRESMTSEHIVDLEKTIIEISEYVEFERYMIEGDDDDE